MTAFLVAILWLAVAPEAAVDAAAAATAGSPELAGARAPAPAPAMQPGRPRWVPSLALAVGATPERLELMLDGGPDQQARRAPWQTGLLVGLGYGLPDAWMPGGRLRGHTSLAVHLELQQGRSPLGLAQEITWQRSPGASLTIGIGAAAAAYIDVGQPALSHVEIGLPLSIRWGAVELMYTPRYAVALGAVRTRVFAGTQAHSAGTGLALVHVALRVHLRGLSW